MPLNLQNEPYILVTDSNNVTTQCIDLDSQNWHKEIIFKGIFGKMRCYEPFDPKIPSQLKSYNSYVYRIYRVKAGVCPICKEALEREQIKESCCRIRKMSIKTGLYRRCFIGACKSSQDFTDWFMNWDSPNWKLIQEIPVDLPAIIKLYKEGSIDFICDYGLCQLLSEKLQYEIN